MSPDERGVHVDAVSNRKATGSVGRGGQVYDSEENGNGRYTKGRRAPGKSPDVTIEFLRPLKNSSRCSSTVMQ